jgi:hypothetical protein
MLGSSPSVALSGVDQEAVRAPCDLLQRLAPDTFSRLITTAYDTGVDTKDFSFAVDDYDTACQARARAQGAAYYQAFGVARDDAVGRQDASGAICLSSAHRTWRFCPRPPWGTTCAPALHRTRLPKFSNSEATAARKGPSAGQRLLRQAGRTPRQPWRRMSRSTVDLATGMP